MVMFWHERAAFQRSAIFGPPDGHFGFCRRCGVAGGERMPPSLLGWYSNKKSAVHTFIVQTFFKPLKFGSDQAETEFQLNTVSLSFMYCLV